MNNKLTPSTVAILLLVFSAMFFLLGLTVSTQFLNSDTVINKYKEKIHQLELSNEITERSYEYSVKELVDYKQKLSVYEKIDTNNISCSIVVETLKKKYEGDVADMKLNLEFLAPRYQLLKEFTMKYYAVTRDTSVIDSLNKYQMMF